MLDGPGMAAPQWLSSTRTVTLVVEGRESSGVPSELCRTGTFISFSTKKNNDVISVWK